MEPVNGDAGHPAAVSNTASVLVDEAGVAENHKRLGSETEGAKTPDNESDLHELGPTGGDARRRVSFAVAPEVYEFNKSEAEMLAEKAWIAEQVEHQASEFEEMKARWAAKAAEAKARGVTADDMDFRRFRTVKVNRGKELAPLGIDLAVREATPPETGTVAVVKEIKRGLELGVVGRSGRGDSSLRKGDRIVKVWDSDLTKVEIGQFLAMLASPSLEFEVYNEIDAASHRAEAARAAAETERLRQEEQKRREREAAELKEAEDKLMKTWLEDAKRREAAQGKQPELGSVIDRSLFRTVSIDRRPQGQNSDDFGLGPDAEDRDEYFKPRDSSELVSLGVSLFVRMNRNARGEEAGTFAVISRVDPCGAVAASGHGHNMIWPDDQIIRVQGRDFKSLNEADFLEMMNCRRLQLVLCNVDEYAAATRNPDLIDDIGRHLGAAMVRIDALAGKLKSAWNVKFDGFLTKVREPKPTKGDGGGPAVATIVRPEDYAMPAKPALLHETSPQVQGSSDILRPRHWCQLWNQLPRRIRYKEARLVYTSAEDGYSMQFFFSKTANLEPLLLAIRTKTNEIIGAYITTPFTDNANRNDGNSSEYRGTNEMFVYSMEPTFKVYHWAGIDLEGHEADAVPRMFLHTAKDRIAIGGGGSHHALVLDDNLQHGLTGRCDTFQNEPLCASSNFECVSIEVWAFTENVDM